MFMATTMNQMFKKIILTTSFILLLIIVPTSVVLVNTYSAPIENTQGLTVSRELALYNNLQIDAPFKSINILNRSSFLRTDYILLAFGLIGYFAVRRRPDR